MSRTGLDGINAPDVAGAVHEAGASIVAGYVNGMWPDYNSLSAKTPGLLHISISVSAAEFAMVLDCEKFDATPAEVPGWVTGARRNGFTPAVYTSASQWPAVRAAVQAAKVEEPYYWVAEWDGKADIPAGAIGKQYKNGLGYDTSVFLDHIPGWDPETPPAHTPNSSRELEMPQIEPLTVHPGEYSFAVDKTRGFTQVEFAVDGYGAQADLRVVTWDSTCHIHDNVTVGGPGFGPETHQAIVKFDIPAETYLVTVRRLDATQIPIGVVFV